VQVDGCSDEEIQARLADQYILKVYHVHKREEGKLAPIHNIFLTFETPTMPEQYYANGTKLNYTCPIQCNATDVRSLEHVDLLRT
jgi:hypothetical protein